LEPLLLYKIPYNGRNGLTYTIYQVGRIGKPRPRGIDSTELFAERSGDHRSAPTPSTVSTSFGSREIEGGSERDVYA